MSEDLIKREDAIETAYQLRHKPNDEEWAEWLEAFNAIPSADRPKGKWEIVTQGRHSFRRCSNCKWTQTYSDPKYMGYEYNFCPNCGADMRGEDNEDK